MDRERYLEHSEREALAAPLAAYRLEGMPIPLHWHRETEWMLPAVPGALEVEGELVRYGAGDLLCVNPGLLHRTPAPLVAADLLVADLSAAAAPLLREEPDLPLNRLAAGALMLPVRVAAGAPGHAALAAAFGACVAAVRERAPGWTLAELSGLAALAGAYVRHGLTADTGPAPHSPQAEAVRRSLGYLQAHLAEPLTLAELAAQASLSPSHFVRVFRQFTGQTPVAWLNEQRLLRAARLLRQGLPVSEAAERVGIANAGYFTRLFRRRYGCSPRQYRQGGGQPDMR